jgi:hypothetical protein
VVGRKVENRLETRPDSIEDAIIGDRPLNELDCGQVQDVGPLG